MKYQVLKLSLAVFVISYFGFACSKSDEIEPIQNNQIQTSGSDELEKKPAWAFFGLTIFLGEPTINPYYNPEIPAGEGNPLVVCLGTGLCKVKIGEAVDSDQVVAYPRKTTEGGLEIYIESSKLSEEQSESFANNQFVVHEDLNLEGDWLGQIGFADNQFTISAGVYEVRESGRYLSITF